MIYSQKRDGQFNFKFQFLKKQESFTALGSYRRMDQRETDEYFNKQLRLI